MRNAARWFQEGQKRWQNEGKRRHSAVKYVGLGWVALLAEFLLCWLTFGHGHRGPTKVRKLKGFLQYYSRGTVHGANPVREDVGGGNNQKEEWSQALNPLPGTGHGHQLPKTRTFRLCIRCEM